MEVRGQLHVSVALPSGKNPGTHGGGGRVGLDVSEKTNIFSLPRIEPKFLGGPKRSLFVTLRWHGGPHFVVAVVPKDTFICLRRIYSLKPSSIKPWGIQTSREKPYLTEFSSSDVCISTKSHLRCSHSTSRLKTLKLWFLFVLPKKKS
jgi:hypothetical protein